MPKTIANDKSRLRINPPNSLAWLGFYPPDAVHGITCNSMKTPVAEKIQHRRADHRCQHPTLPG